LDRKEVFSATHQITAISTVMAFQALAILLLLLTCERSMGQQSSTGVLMSYRLQTGACRVVS
jgi:hypothetical protein